MKLLHEGVLCGQIPMLDLQPAEGIPALRGLQLAVLQLARQNVANRVILGYLALPLNVTE
jgi:hypothetical protein